MRRRTLRATIAKLEKRRASRRPRRLIVFTVEGLGHDRITALGGVRGEPTARRWNETLGALASRARAGGGARILLARVTPEALADVPDAAPSPVLAPPPPPAPEPPPPAPPSDRKQAWAAFRASKGM